MTTYINSREFRADPFGGIETVEVHNWRDFTHARLWWLYGPERALQISKGNDPDTNADLAKWAKLGRRDAA